MSGRAGRRRDLAFMAAITIVVAAIAASGLGARATYGARTSADEPHYLLSALSLARDGDLDVADEIARGEYRPFHELRLDPQTTPVDAAGRQFSPHDPLLPLLLAPAVAAGGLIAAKGLLAVIAGLVAALTWWVAHRRLDVDRCVAALVVVGAGASMPLVSYGTQVYPEGPAALACIGAVAAVSGARVGPRHLLALAAAVVALPWLGVKYVPVAAALAATGLWRSWRGGNRRAAAVTAAGLGVAAALYAVVHHRIYGGWTVYAAGDHFIETGELSVVGTGADYPGRSRRLVGLLVDRRYGLVPWAPLWLLAVPAVATALLRPGAGALGSRRWVLLAPLVAGWLTAAFVALTMHGFWSPGRQVVIVAPIVVLAVAALVDRVRALVPVALVLSLLGSVNWLWLAWEATTGRRTLIVDAHDTAAWPYRLVDIAFPDGIRAAPGDDAGLIGWALVLAVAAWVVVRRLRAPT